MNSALLTASGIYKSFPVDGGSIEVLHGVDLTIGDGEFVAVMGPSGSGKSTLLYSVSGMDTVDAGTVNLGDLDLTARPARSTAALPVRSWTCSANSTPTARP